MKRLIRTGKFTVLGAMLALGGLVSANTLPVAHADNEPYIVAYNSGSDVSVLGSGFTRPNYQNPHPQVRVEVLTPSLTPLGTVYLNVNQYGEISGDVTGNDMPCFQGYSGMVYVAADGQPGPTAWTTTNADFPPTCPIRWR
ncbi:MAG TPA: hypothetical protein VN837_12120 [Chloroflexota bacterium]|nr:hypothetical protein [Chloroflexota bacterium]